MSVNDIYILDIVSLPEWLAPGRWGAASLRAGGVGVGPKSPGAHVSKRKRRVMGARTIW